MVKNKIRRKLLNEIYSDWRLLNRQLKLRQIQNPTIDLILPDGSILKPKYLNKDLKNEIIDNFINQKNWIPRDQYKKIIQQNNQFKIKILQYKNISTDDDRFHRMEWDRKMDSQFFLPKPKGPDPKIKKKIFLLGFFGLFRKFRKMCF